MDVIEAARAAGAHASDESDRVVTSRAFIMELMRAWEDAELVSSKRLEAFVTVTERCERYVHAFLVQLLLAVE